MDLQSQALPEQLCWQVCTIHGAEHKLPKLLAAAVGNASFCLRTAQQLITGFSEVATIIFTWGSPPVIATARLTSRCC